MFEKTKKMMAVMLGAGMLAGILAGCGSKEAEQVSETENTGKVIRVGVECAFAPYNWEESEETDTNLPISNNEGFYAEGYDIQIAKQVAENMNVEIEVVKLPWEGLLEGLNHGQVDMIVSGMVDSDVHKQAAAFSDTYATAKTEYGLLVQSDSEYANATQLSDFTGASMLGQKGTKLDTVIDQIEGVDHIAPVDTIPNMLERLNNRTVDAIVINLESAEAYVKQYPNFTIIDFPDDAGFVLDFNGICIGVRKEDTELLNDVNEALAKIPTEKREELMEYATSIAGE